MRRTGLSRLRRDEGGFSIVEVLMASVILAVGLLALASTAIPSIRGLQVAQGRQAAVAAATRTLETARQLPYEQLAMLNSAFPAGTFDPDVAGPLGAERLARTNDGAVTQALPFWGPTGDRVEVETHVTLWCDAAVACDTLGDEDGRRVTVTATWRSGNGEHTTRTSTIIARLDR